MFCWSSASGAINLDADCYGGTIRIVFPRLVGGLWLWRSENIARKRRRLLGCSTWVRRRYGLLILKVRLRRWKISVFRYHVSQISDFGKLSNIISVYNCNWIQVQVQLRSLTLEAGSQPGHCETHETFVDFCINVFFIFSPTPRIWVSPNSNALLLPCEHFSWHWTLRMQDHILWTWSLVDVPGRRPVRLCFTYVVCRLDPRGL